MTHRQLTHRQLSLNWVRTRNSHPKNPTYLIFYTFLSKLIIVTGNYGSIFTQPEALLAQNLKPLLLLGNFLPPMKYACYLCDFFEAKEWQLAKKQKQKIEDLSFSFKRKLLTLKPLKFLLFICFEKIMA